MFRCVRSVSRLSRGRRWFTEASAVHLSELMAFNGTTVFGNYSQPHEPHTNAIAIAGRQTAVLWWHRLAHQVRSSAMSTDVPLLQATKKFSKMPVEHSQLGWRSLFMYRYVTIYEHYQRSDAWFWAISIWCFEECTISEKLHHQTAVSAVNWRSSPAADSGDWLPVHQTARHAVAAPASDFSRSQCHIDQRSIDFPWTLWRHRGT